MSITLFTWYNLSNQKAKWPCFLTSPSSYLALASLALLQPGAVSQHPAASKPWLNNQLGGPQNTFSGDKPLASFSHLENLTLNFLSEHLQGQHFIKRSFRVFTIKVDQLRGPKLSACKGWVSYEMTSSCLYHSLKLDAAERNRGLEVHKFPPGPRKTNHTYQCYPIIQMDLQ